ncbi:cupin domain-containing protein [Arenibacter latericius]|uniref:cupin domain-containing protein n=1 Tax=Arenibacter latericius TaxID=86104 RepID=UPI0004065EED|nr:cupin [Arenibacter latericius]MDX1363331.1 cupin [Arenibacter latericius]
MEVLTKPELTHKTVGKSLKILQITALAGMDMPLHHNTKETVIVVHKGEAILKTQHKEFVLKKGATLLVPAFIDHSLRVIQDFNAVAIMQTETEINFNYI